MRASINYWIIWYAVALHVTWGLLLLVSADPAKVTAVNHVRLALGGRWTSAVGLLVIGGLAGIGLTLQIRWLSLAMLLPQQFILILSALGALNSIATSTFADGAIYPRAFIAADQLPAILAATFHTCAIVEYHWQELLHLYYGDVMYVEAQICASVIEPLAAVESLVAKNADWSHKILGIAIRELRPELLSETEEVAAHKLAGYVRPKCDMSLLFCETLVSLICLRLVRWVLADLTRYESIKAIQTIQEAT